MLKITQIGFLEKKDNVLGTYYDCDIIITDFDNWINGGMK